MRNDIYEILDQVTSEINNQWRVGEYARFPEQRAKLLHKAAFQLEQLFAARLAKVGIHAALDQMAEVVSKTGQPSAYALDFFKHDRHALEQEQPTCFAWALRPTGTHLLIPGRGPDSCMDWARACARSGQEQSWYVWTGTELKPCTAQEALDRLARAETDMAEEHKA